MNMLSSCFYRCLTLLVFTLQNHYVWQIAEHCSYFTCKSLLENVAQEVAFSFRIYRIGVEENEQ